MSSTGERRSPNTTTEANRGNGNTAGRLASASAAPAAPVFDADSLPVYVAVQGHRFAAKFALEKIRNVKEPTIQRNGDVVLHIAPNGVGHALRMAEVARKKGDRIPKEFAFWFQPKFDEATGSDDPNRLVASVMWLEFSREEIETVCERVDATAASRKAHIVLTVVANDGPYADLSVTGGGFVYLSPAQRLQHLLQSLLSQEIGAKEQQKLSL